MKRSLKLLFILLIAVSMLIISACSSILRDDQGKTASESHTPSESSQKLPETTVSITTDALTDSLLTVEELIIDEPTEFSFKALRSYLTSNPSLRKIDASGVLLTSEEYADLCSINADVTIISKISLGNVIMDLTLAEIDISGTKVENKRDFETMLGHFPSGIKLIMCDCGYTDDEMGALRDKFPNLEFVWQIHMGKWSIRTDDEAFSVMIYDDNYTRLTSEDIKVLRYCTNLYALDLGHQAITDLSVIGELTDLRVLILADNKITDLTPLANLKKLQYLELFVNRISDLSPLASCTELVDLNFGWNSVWDLSSIYSLPKIERLWLPTNPVSENKRSEISEVFSSAQIVFEDENSISSGWRTHERYFSMRGMFTNNKYDDNFVK